MIRLRIGCQRAKLQPARGVLDFWKPKINIWEIESEKEKGERSEEKRKRSAALLSGPVLLRLWVWEPKLLLRSTSYICLWRLHE